MAYNPEESDQTNVVWNMDDKENSLIFDLKASFILNLRAWNLEQSYWDLLILSTESDALFHKNVRTEIEDKLKELSDFRTRYNSNSNNENLKPEYFLKLNNLYKEICREIVEEALYFRKKKQYTGL